MQLHAPACTSPRSGTNLDERYVSPIPASFVRLPRYPVPSALRSCFVLDSQEDGLGPNLKCCVIDKFGLIPLPWQMEAYVDEEDAYACKQTEASLPNSS